MRIFEKVVTVRLDGLRYTVQWDGAEGFVVEAAFIALGQRSEEERPAAKVRADLARWSSERGLEVLFADEAALDKIMEGTAWQGLPQAIR